MPNTTRLPATVPCLRYRNAPAAIDFLCNAFGFERHFVLPGEGGTIAHAQLTFGGGMVMLGSGHADATDLVGDSPAFGIYVVVADPDAVCAQARAAGAEIVNEPKDEEYGGRGFKCRDPEGFAWSFGSYDPWAVEQTRSNAAA